MIVREADKPLVGKALEVANAALNDGEGQYVDETLTVDRDALAEAVMVRAAVPQRVARQAVKVVADEFENEISWEMRRYG